MMISEFIERVGFEPTYEEYKAIEEAYYNFDGNKDEFCKHWVKNCGVEGIAKARAQKIEYLKSQAIEVEKNLMKELASRDAEIERLKKKLEREQEWKPYVIKDAVAQESYDSLKASATCQCKRDYSSCLTDDEAKEWIADEFGFDSGKIHINRTMNTYEVNRHGMLRKTGEIERNPYYEATDWYYVFFTVRGLSYEA